MFTTPLPTSKTSSTDSLLDLLSSPKKAEEALKKLKAENAKLIKNTKALMKAKSLTAYCKEQENKAEDYKKRAQDAIASIAEEREAASVQNMKEKKAIQTAISSLNKKEKADKAREAELNEFEDVLITAEKQLKELQLNAQAQLERGMELQEEYTTKLNDLKERMRGL